MMSSSATVRVDKATSEFLMGPDWTMNIEICDMINSSNWFAKDVVKTLKKRLQHKSPKVHLLALTLLETMIKNCGDYVHFQIAERNILQEMIKITKKGTEAHVRDKILVLLDSWQEAFGGPQGKYPQYYWAYEELRRSGVIFPERSSNPTPIFTPPITHPSSRHAQAGYGMPSDTPRRLDEAMASETENISSSNMDSMRSVLDLLTDMLQALNPNDQQAVKDEVIAELVDRCRSNQKKLIQILSSTGDEEVLGQGLELNDSLQSLLARHDALASGSPLPAEERNTKPTSMEERDASSRQNEARDSSPLPNEARDYRPQPNTSPSTQTSSVTSFQLEDEEEEDDDFAQLARRSKKHSAKPSEGTSSCNGEGCSNGTTLSVEEAPHPSPSNELALSEAPAPVRITSKEQDMIDLLSITLSTTSNSTYHPQTAPPDFTQNMNQISVSPEPAIPSNQNVHPLPPSTHGYSYGFHHYPENQGQSSYDSYIVPWARPQPQPQLQPQPQPQYPQYSSKYPPPPWATNTANSNQIPVATAAPYLTMTDTNAASSNVSLPMDRSYTPRLAPPPFDNKKFVPTYRLFEELNVLGSAEKGLNRGDSMSPRFSSTGQGMVGGRK